MMVEGDRPVPRGNSRPAVCYCQKFQHKAGEDELGLNPSPPHWASAPNRVAHGGFVSLNWKVNELNVQLMEVQLTDFQNN